MSFELATVCPVCRADLAESWTGEACGRCGFRYAVPVALEPEPVDRGPDPVRWVSRQAAGVAAFALALLAGGALNNSEMITPIETSAGEALLFNPPDTAFVWAIALGFISILLIIYATQFTTSGRRSA